MVKAIKVMLIPNNVQETKMFEYAGAARFAYNWALAREKEKKEKAASRFLVFHKASDFSDGTDPRWIMLLLLWRLCRQGCEASLRGGRARAEI